MVVLFTVTTANTILTATLVYTVGKTIDLANPSTMDSKIAVTVICNFVTIEMGVKSPSQLTQGATYCYIYGGTYRNWDVIHRPGIPIADLFPSQAQLYYSKSLIFFLSVSEFRASGSPAVHFWVLQHRPFELCGVHIFLH